METIQTREQLAAELLRGCPEESLADHQAIAAKILEHANSSAILGMEETDNWPETYTWLSGFSDILDNPE